jgi:hypothetical protein
MFGNMVNKLFLYERKKVSTRRRKSRNKGFTNNEGKIVPAQAVKAYGRVDL